MTENPELPGDLSPFPEPTESLPAVEAVEAESAPSPQVADSNAGADLARTPRAAQFRAQRRTQFSTALTGLLLIGFGGLLLAESLAPGQFTPETLSAAGFGALGLAVLARFVFNGRRERGLAVIGFGLLSCLGVGALAASGAILPAQIVPFGLIAVGISILLAFFFERSHERGLILPALMCMTGGSAALPFVSGLIPLDVLNALATYYPLLLLLAALALLPLAIRTRL